MGSWDDLMHGSLKPPGRGRFRNPGGAAPRSSSPCCSSPVFMLTFILTFVLYISALALVWILPWMFSLRCCVMPPDPFACALYFTRERLCGCHGNQTAAKLPCSPRRPGAASAGRVPAAAGSSTRSSSIIYPNSTSTSQASKYPHPSPCARTRTRAYAHVSARPPFEASLPPAHTHPSKVP